MLGLLRRNRDLRLLFFAQVVSYLGDWFADVALLGLVLDLTHADLAASGILVAGLLPTFLVSPVAGAAVDRFDRQRLVVGVSILQCGFALALLAVGEHTVWLAFVARAGITALAAFVAPSAQAAIPNLVDAHDLPTANALLGSVWGAMLAAGAAIGGAFTVAFGRDASFVADGMTFVATAALVAAIRRPMNAPREPALRRAPMRPARDTVEVLRYARTRREVLLLVLSKAGLGLAGGVVGILAVYAKEVFHAGDAGIGLLLAARGAGAVLGPVLGRRVMHRGTASILAACGWAGVVYGAGYALVAAAPALVPAMLAVLVAHFAGGSQWTMSSHGLQVATPDHLRGRVFAADFALATLTMSISYLAAGWGSSAFGPRPVTVALAAVAALWSAVYLALSRDMRRAAATVAADVD